MGDTGTTHATPKLSGLENTVRQPTEDECFDQLIAYLASIAKT